LHDFDRCNQGTEQIPAFGTQIEIKVDFKENLYLLKYAVRPSYEKILATSQTLKLCTESLVAVDIRLCRKQYLKLCISLWAVN
jgi:hypothetical protein